MTTQQLPEPDTQPKAQLREDAYLFTDITILCHPDNAKNLAEIFEREISAMQGVWPMHVISYGRSRLLHQGVVTLMSNEGSVSPVFLARLQRDIQITDYFFVTRQRSQSKKGTHP
jgi:hypothetical protein